MTDFETVTVIQAPVILLARGLQSAADAIKYYDILAKYFDAPILEPTLRRKAEVDEPRLINSAGKETEFTRDPAKNIYEILSALNGCIEAGGGDIFLGTISNVKEAQLVEEYGLTGGISPEHFPDVVAYAIEHGVEYYPALKNIDEAYDMVDANPGQKSVKFFPVFKKDKEGNVVEEYFTSADVLEFARKNPDVTISVTGGIKTPEEIKNFLEINYMLGCESNPRIFVGMGIYEAPKPVESIEANVKMVAQAVRELEVKYGKKLGKEVTIKRTTGGNTPPSPSALTPAI